MATMARSPVLALLATAVATALSCGTCPPTPLISSISPSLAIAGGNQFLLTVSGDGFLHNSAVRWNSSFRPTTFISSHQLVAIITAVDIEQPGTVPVMVFNPSGGTTIVSGAIGVMSTIPCSGKNSNAVIFTISP